MLATIPTNGHLESDLLIPSRLGIIGFGIVGQAVAYGFSQTSNELDQIKFYDKFKDSTPLEEVIRSSDFIFVSVPTPMKSDESGIDLSIIEEVVKQITKLTNNTDKIIILKSTITPGTTKRLAKKYPKSHFCFSPEFLTEANYLNDFLNADKTVIGAEEAWVLRKVVTLFKNHFPNTQIYETDPTTAETVKYFANTFLATKITFANLFYDYCQKLGINYDVVKDIAATDIRIGNRFLNVTTERGFGLKCFPKDLVALMGEIKKTGCDSSIFEAVWKYNKKVRKVHDWEEIPFAVEGNHKKTIKK